MAAAEEPIVAASGAALVEAMAADDWPSVRAEVVAFWRRARPVEADDVAAELVEVRAEVLAARQAGDPDLERALAGIWQGRVQRLLDAEPALTDPLRQLLTKRLAPRLAAGERTRTGPGR